jgi:iron only hydrogenase large subunit-like protein
VTSAEAMLIQEQGVDKLEERLMAQDCVVIVALSPNSIASVAHALKISYSETFLKICSVLKIMGVKYVLDASAGGDVALFESRHEFMKR